MLACQQVLSPLLEAPMSDWATPFLVQLTQAAWPHSTGQVAILMLTVAKRGKHSKVASVPAHSPASRVKLVDRRVKSPGAAFVAVSGVANNGQAGQCGAQRHLPSRCRGPDMQGPGGVPDLDTQPLARREQVVRLGLPLPRI